LRASSRVAQTSQCGRASAGRPKRSKSINPSDGAVGVLRHAEVPARADQDADLATHPGATLQHEAYPGEGGSVISSVLTPSDGPPAPRGY